MIPLIFLHFSVTLFMTGIIWFVQVVHYPLFGAVPPNTLQLYCKQHTTRTTWVVVLPMIIELFTGILLLALIPSLFWLLNLSLLTLIWISTFFIQIPEHEKLVHKGTTESVYLLSRNNWGRTVFWTTRALLLFLYCVNLVTQYG